LTGKVTPGGNVFKELNTKTSKKVKRHEKGIIVKPGSHLPWNILCPWLQVEATTNNLIGDSLKSIKDFLLTPERERFAMTSTRMVSITASHSQKPLGDA
jgi:hypothetical protein